MKATIIANDLTCRHIPEAIAFVILPNKVRVIQEDRMEIEVENYVSIEISEEKRDAKD